ncbi:MAG: PilZ domain-containing protein [Desulforegulaceae bacterium]|nr:PilZ domain-containing protein [Desulforegulaceae bacterium]
MKVERRKYPHRSESANLVYFAIFYPDKTLKQQGMGKTINISEGGILLETHEKLIDDQLISLSLGLNNETVDLEAKLVHFTKNKEGLYHSGLSFIIDSIKKTEAIKKYITIFEQMK